MARGFDIVGDVHGRFDAMMELVTDIGYSVQSDGALEHEGGDRQLIFVGDLINKGPQNKDVLDVVRASEGVGTARAILGNHELFHICYARTGADGEFLTPHSEKADRFLKTFLDEFPFGSDVHKDAIDWMAQLPVYIDLPDAKVFHAMHSSQDIERLHAYMNPDQSLRDEAFELHGSMKKDGYKHHGEKVDVFWAMERTLFGSRIATSDAMRAADYTKRWRVNWWVGADADSEKLLGVDGHGLNQDFIDDLSARLSRLRTQQRHAFEVPDGLSFFGHYSLRSEPAVTSEKALCLDFSGADNRGVLTAYRFNEGDTEFNDDQLVSVDAPFPEPDCS